MEKKAIVFEDLIAEASATAAINFAAGAMNSAIHQIIQESGSILKEEVSTIEKLYEKIISEAMEDVVPSDDELQDIIKQLEAAGYTVTSAEEVTADDDADAPADAADGDADAPADAADGEPVQESIDLAAKIAAKLEIL